MSFSWADEPVVFTLQAQAGRQARVSLSLSHGLF